MKKNKMDEKLLPYLPETIRGARYEDGRLVHDLTAREFHAAVSYAMCMRQRALSNAPEVPVLSFDVIGNLGRFATAYRTVKTIADGFVPLEKEADKLGTLFLYDLPINSGKDAGGAKPVRAANITDKAAVYAAMAHLNKAPDGVTGEYCIPVGFDKPVAKDKRGREYDGVCFVIKEGRVINAFPFVTK